MRNRRLLWQLYASYLLITVVSLALTAWYASSTLRQFHIDRTAEDLEARSVLVAEQVRPLLAVGEHRQVDDLCKKLGPLTSTRITIVLPDGKVIGDSLESPDGMENHADRPEIVAALAGRTGASLHDSRTLQEMWRYVAVPVRQEGRVLGVVRTSLSLAEIDHTVRGIRLPIALGSLVLAVVLAVVSLAISRRVTQPLEQLQQGAERFARGDLSHRLPIVDSLELGALATTLNQMAAELDDKIRAMVRQRNEREAILSSMVEGIMAFDGEERLIRLNQSAARLIGIEPDKAQGRSLQELIRSAPLHRLVTKVLATQVPGEAEIVLYDAGERFVHVHATALRGTGEEVGVLLGLHDVTELKKLERIRREFVATVSQELRTPAQSIRAFAETLSKEVAHGPEELQRVVRLLASQTDCIHAIIEDLLTLARVEQELEKAEPSLALGPIRRVLEDAVEVCQGKAMEKNVRMELTCDLDLEARINAPLLEQALVNLLDNAIKYSSPGQAVEIESLRFQGEVVLRVRDHGIGISPHHQPRVFERFYRGDQTQSRRLGGTGLGLAIVQHIAQLHGGHATVQSVPGQGSTFSIHLPLPPG